MFQTLRNAWKEPDIRKKILMTLLLLLIYRLGSFIPVAGINVEFVKAEMGKYSILGFMDILSGGSTGNWTAFAMGIIPYINASIIMQLLTVALPKLEAMAKEGEEGRKKIAQITRYFTVVLAFVQSIGILVGLGSGAMINPTIWNYILVGLSLTAGTAFVMWLGEKITEYGIGNGMSLLVFIGIISGVPSIIQSAFDLGTQNTSMFYISVAFFIGLVLVIAAVVFIDQGQRRIPVQYAKRVVGRKMYGGQSTHIPMKVNSSGVLPLIFASSLIYFPFLIIDFFQKSDFVLWIKSNLGPSTVPYVIVYAVLIIFFCFFYSMITFNPAEVAKNLQQYGGYILGLRPGKSTAEFLTRVTTRLTFIGGIFLVVLAVLPQLFIGATGGLAGAFGPTSVLIVVSVALESSKQLESQLMMRHYKGFLK